MSAKIEELGLGTLSDLKYVLDVEQCFLDLLKPVGVGKLKEFIDGTLNKKERSASSTALSVIDFEDVFSRNFLLKLKGDVRVPKRDRLQLAREMGNELRSKTKTVTRDMCMKVATALLNNFDKALGYETKQKGIVDMAYRIYNSAIYVRRRERTKKAEVVTQCMLQPEFELRKFSTRQCYALVPERDLPTEFPPNETRETQEQKQKLLIEMSRGGEIKWKEVSRLMQETYVSQRAKINSITNMEEILEVWPFFGKFSILQRHFCALMDLKRENYSDRMTSLFPSYLRFLTAEANRTRRNSAAEISKQLKEVIRKYERLPEAQKNESNLMMTVLLCLSVKMKEDLQYLFLHFDETSSFDEVQASPSLPDNGKPIVVVLGNDVQTDPKCWVVVDKRIINTEFLTPMKAVLAAFMCYFILKETYPKKIAALMEFLQRSVFQIDSLGSRVDRSKTSKGWECAPKGINSKYLTITQEYKDYCAEWDMN